MEPDWNALLLLGMSQLVLSIVAYIYKLSYRNILSHYIGFLGNDVFTRILGLKIHFREYYCRTIKSSPLF